MPQTLNDLRYIYYATALGIPLDQAYAQSLNDLEYKALATGALTPGGGGGTSMVSDTIWDAKGDLAIGTGPDAATKLPVGTNGQALFADSTAPNGLRWGTVTDGTSALTTTGDLLYYPAAGTNYALGRTASATGGTFSGSPAQVVDGNTGTGWLSGTDGGQWQVDLASPQTVVSIRVVGCTDARGGFVRFYYSSDGTNFTYSGFGFLSPTPDVTVSISPSVTARYWRVVPTAPPGPAILQVNEVYIQGPATPTRLPVGTTGQALQVISGVPAWAAMSPTGTAGGSLTGTYPNPTIATNAIGGAMVNDAALDNVKLAMVNSGTFKGRVSGGFNIVEDMTATQATSLLNNFTSTLKGLTPPSGGGTANFLRADGSFSATTTGELTATDFKATGLTGATSGARFVGATTSGPPSTGTFLLGDWVVDQAGQMWVCTTAGSPGTWTAPGSGRELAYAEVTADQSVTVIGAANRVDLTGLSITFTPSSRPVFVQLWTRYFFHSTPSTANGMSIAICDSTNAIMADCNAVAAAASGTPNPIGSPFRRLSLTPGTPVTYKGMTYCVLGATATFKASAGGPSFIRAWEV